MNIGDKGFHENEDRWGILQNIEQHFSSFWREKQFPFEWKDKIQGVNFVHIETTNRNILLACQSPTLPIWWIFKCSGER